jgi:hypothetical protein
MAAEGEAPLDATFYVLRHINETGHEVVVTNRVERGGRETWAQWLSRDDCIELARQAYRSGDVDGYNYHCYLFARTFVHQRPFAVGGDATKGARLIPSAPPTPFVAGLERELPGPNPPLLQKAGQARPPSWPAVVFDESWNFGCVKVSSNPAPSRLERVAINWNTESLWFLP